jgi:hypothetical protein
MENPVDKFLEMADIPEHYLDEDAVKKARDYAEAEIAVTIEDNLRIELGESRLWAGVDLPIEDNPEDIDYILLLTAEEFAKLKEIVLKSNDLGSSFGGYDSAELRRLKEKIKHLEPRPDNLGGCILCQG